MATTSNIYDLTDTWDDGATTFVAIQMDVTDTASAAASKLIDLQKGSVSQFNVDKDGNLTLAGTVDGRDVATDGAKLDLIEAQADVTDTDNVRAAGALMDDELTSEASVKALNQGVATTDSPTFATTTLTGQLNGPADFIIDPAVVGNNEGKVTIKGDLQVDGDTTTINSTTLTVDDTEIVVASGAPDAATADSAGLRVDGAAATMLYRATGDKWQFNKNMDVQGNITVGGTVTTVTDAGNTVDVRRADRIAQASSVNVDGGATLYDVTATATLTLSDLVAGDIVTVFSRSGTTTIARGTITYAYIDGDIATNKTSVTVGAGTLATVTMVSNDTAIIAGSSLT